MNVSEALYEYFTLLDLIHDVITCKFANYTHFDLYELLAERSPQKKPGSTMF